MIRRYNYTGRRKLLSKKIRIAESIQNGNKSFELKGDLKEMGFPDDAKIYVEPYFKSSFIRYDFGSIARFQHPDNTNVSELPTTDLLHYRIKIVDTTNKLGLILGFADIQGELANNETGGRQAILPVDFVDLGKRIWTLDFRITGPVLEINSLIDNIREKVKSDDIFFSLVYPEIIKRVALEVTRTDGFYEDDLTGWQAEWMRFFTNVLLQTQVLSSDASDDVVDDWCNDIADAFARKYHVFQRYTSQTV